MSNTLTKGLKRHDAKARRKIKRLFKMHMIDTQGEAQRRAPVDTGFLRGDVDPNKTALTVEVTRRGLLLGTIYFLAEYAEPQHEHTEFIHPLGGQSKYLISAIRAKKYSALFKRIKKELY